MIFIDFLRFCWVFERTSRRQNWQILKCGTICYKMNVSRASGTPCGSSYGHFCFFVWFFVIFVTFQGGFRHWDPFQTNPCAKSYKMNVSRASGTPCGSSYGHFCFLMYFFYNFCHFPGRFATGIYDIPGEIWKFRLESWLERGVILLLF